MAAGGGLYLTAMFATGMVLLALLALGHLEETFNLKILLTSYEVTGASVEEISNEVNRILEGHHRMMQNVHQRQHGPAYSAAVRCRWLQPRAERTACG